MKKSRIKQIIKEVLLEEKGYSKYIPGGETSGLDKKTLDNILLRIAKGEQPSEEEDSVARGNRILDKADPENVKRILGGEGLGEIKVNNPNKTKEDLAQIVREGFKIAKFSKFNDYDVDLLHLNQPYAYDNLSQEEINTLYNYVKDQLGSSEIKRMQELAGLKQEIKVNNPNKLSFDYDEDDDDGELKIISISKDGEEWFGNEPYLENPGVINIEFLFEGGEDNEDEQEMMDKLVSLLKQTNTEFKEIDVNNDGGLIYIQIPKDKLDLK